MILFCKMFIVFYTVKIVYICVFMTLFTSYCLCDMLMDPQNVCIYLHIHVCRYQRPGNRKYDE
jgi:hypothetical protein